MCMIVNQSVPVCEREREREHERSVAVCNLKNP